MQTKAWEKLIKEVLEGHKISEPLEGFIERMERMGFTLIFHKGSVDDKLFFTKVMEYLNHKKGGTPFLVNYPSPASKLILALKNKGFTFENILTVIDIKYAEWKDTEQWKWFRWKTLFNDTNFQNYVTQDAPTTNKATTTFDKFAASISKSQERVSSDSAE